MADPTFRRLRRFFDARFNVDVQGRAVDARRPYHARVDVKWAADGDGDGADADADARHREEEEHEEEEEDERLTGQRQEEQQEQEGQGQQSGFSSIFFGAGASKIQQGRRGSRQDSLPAHQEASLAPSSPLQAERRGSASASGSVFGFGFSAALPERRGSAAGSANGGGSSTGGFGGGVGGGTGGGGGAGGGGGCGGGGGGGGSGMSSILRNGSLRLSPRKKKASRSALSLSLSGFADGHGYGHGPGPGTGSEKEYDARAGRAPQKIRVRTTLPAAPQHQADGTAAAAATSGESGGERSRERQKDVWFNVRLDLHTVGLAPVPERVKGEFPASHRSAILCCRLRLSEKLTPPHTRPVRPPASHRPPRNAPKAERQMRRQRAFSQPRRSLRRVGRRHAASTSTGAGAGTGTGPGTGDFGDLTLEQVLSNESARSGSAFSDSSWRSGPAGLGVSGGGGGGESGVHSQAWHQHHLQQQQQQQLLLQATPRATPDAGAQTQQFLSGSPPPLASLPPPARSLSPSASASASAWSGSDRGALSSPTSGPGPGLGGGGGGGGGATGVDRRPSFLQRVFDLGFRDKSGSKRTRSFASAASNSNAPSTMSASSALSIADALSPTTTTTTTTGAAGRSGGESGFSTFSGAGDHLRRERTISSNASWEPHASSAYSHEASGGSASLGTSPPTTTASSQYLPAPLQHQHQPPGSRPTSSSSKGRRWSQNSSSSRFNRAPGEASAQLGSLPEGFTATISPRLQRPQTGTSNALSSATSDDGEGDALLLDGLLVGGGDGERSDVFSPSESGDEHVFDGVSSAADADAEAGPEEDFIVLLREAAHFALSILDPPSEQPEDSTAGRGRSSPFPGTAGGAEADLKGKGRAYSPASFRSSHLSPAIATPVSGTGLLTPPGSIEWEREQEQKRQDFRLRDHVEEGKAWPEGMLDPFPVAIAAALGQALGWEGIMDLCYGAGSRCATASHDFVALGRAATLHQKSSHAAASVLAWRSSVAASTPASPEERDDGASPFAPGTLEKEEEEEEDSVLSPTSAAAQDGPLAWIKRWTARTLNNNDDSKDGSGTRGKRRDSQQRQKNDDGQGGLGRSTWHDWLRLFRSIAAWVDEYEQTRVRAGLAPALEQQGEQQQHPSEQRCCSWTAPEELEGNALVAPSLLKDMCDAQHTFRRYPGIPDPLPAGPDGEELPSYRWSRQHLDTRHFSTPLSEYSLCMFVLISSADSADLNPACAALLSHSLREATSNLSTSDWPYRSAWELDYLEACVFHSPVIALRFPPPSFEAVRVEQSFQPVHFPEQADSPSLSVGGGDAEEPRRAAAAAAAAAAAEQAARAHLCPMPSASGAWSSAAWVAWLRQLREGQILVPAVAWQGWWTLIAILNGADRTGRAFDLQVKAYDESFDVLTDMRNIYI